MNRASIFETKAHRLPLASSRKPAKVDQALETKRLIDSLIKRTLKNEKEISKETTG